MTHKNGEFQMEWVRIVLLWIGFAGLYGILHDQVTARVCVEYFTFGHSPVFRTESPTLLAFGWGVLATWWAGLAMGWTAACFSRLGSGPKLDARAWLHPLLRLSVVVAVMSSCAGIAGYFAASTGWTTLASKFVDVVPEQKHASFVADLWAHRAAYVTGMAGSLVVCLWTFRQRLTAKCAPRIINGPTGG